MGKFAATYCVARESGNHANPHTLALSDRSYFRETVAHPLQYLQSYGVVPGDRVEIISEEQELPENLELLDDRRVSRENQ